MTVRRLSAQNAQLQQQVWTDYVQRMIERKRDTQHYSSHQIITWLSFLARQMRDHNQTIFHLEQLQPDWLTKRQKRFYRLSIGPVYGLVAALVAALIVGLIFGLGTALVDGLTWRLIDGLATGLVSGLFLGLIIGPINALVSGLFFGLKARIEPVEVLTWSWKHLPSRLAAGLAVWLFFGLLFGLADELANGLLFGLPFGLVAALSFGFSGKPLIERLMLSPNEGMRRSLKNGLVGGLVYGLIIGLIIELIAELIAGLFFGLIYAPILGLIVALITGLFSGLGAATQHYTLRIFLWRTHTFPWKAQRFLDDAVTCILLQRVGGGYSFVHRLLMDHLAYLHTGPTPTPATNSPMPRNSPPSNNPLG